MSVASTKPYLIRAIYEWCVDQGYTPYAAVVVDGRTEVPRAYVKDGQIVLNLSPEAVHQLVLGNEFITCSARFGGVAQNISVPIDSVAAVYARENGHGMAFEVSPDAPLQSVDSQESNQADPSTENTNSDPASGDEQPTRPTPGRPHLTRVK